jgi:hypothetical protein
LEPTNAVGLVGLERAIGKAIRAGRVRDLPRLYDRRAQLLFNTGNVARAISELEEGISVITRGAGRAIGAGTPELWRLFYRVALLYRMTGARALARQMAMEAMFHAAACPDEDEAKETVDNLVSSLLDRHEAVHVAYYPTDMALGA